jgi:hypothetical protein
MFIYSTPFSVNFTENFNSAIKKATISHRLARFHRVLPFGSIAMSEFNV